SLSLSLSTSRLLLSHQRRQPAATAAPASSSPGAVLPSPLFSPRRFLFLSSLLRPAASLGKHRSNNSQPTANKQSRRAAAPADDKPASSRRRKRPQLQPEATTAPTDSNSKPARAQETNSRRR
ncbi:hypothetical protein AABB24_030853, partial [Solanum stoloniferum]